MIKIWGQEGRTRGNFIVSFFLEQDLQAQNCLAKLRLKSGTNDYVKVLQMEFILNSRNDSVGNKILQLVVGGS